MNLSTLQAPLNDHVKTCIKFTDLSETFLATSSNRRPFQLDKMGGHKRTKGGSTV